MTLLDLRKVALMQIIPLWNLELILHTKICIKYVNKYLPSFVNIYINFFFCRTIVIILLIPALNVKPCAINRRHNTIAGMHLVRAMFILHEFHEKNK